LTEIPVSIHFTDLDTVVTIKCSAVPHFHLMAVNEGSA
jgi:hypothetical protein